MAQKEPFSHLVGAPAVGFVKCGRVKIVECLVRRLVCNERAAPVFPSSVSCDVCPEPVLATDRFWYTIRENDATNVPAAPAMSTPGQLYWSSGSLARS